MCAKRQKSEIFCLAAKGEIFGLRHQVKSNADAFGEMKSTHRRRGDFTARRAISPPQAISPTLKGWISLPTVLWDSRLKRAFFSSTDPRRGSAEFHIRRKPDISQRRSRYFTFCRQAKYFTSLPSGRIFHFSFRDLSRSSSTTLRYSPGVIPV